MKKIFIIFLIIFIPIHVFSESGEKMYSWTDENGTQHFSNTPVYNGKDIHSWVDRHGNKHFAQPDPDKIQSQNHIYSNSSIKTDNELNTISKEKKEKFKPINLPNIVKLNMFKSLWKYFLILFILAFIVFLLKGFERKLDRKNKIHRDKFNFNSTENNFSNNFGEDINFSEFKGHTGERTVIDLTYKFLDRTKYFLFNDIFLKQNNKTTQIDHILLSKHGVFVIETKNYNGLIYGKRDESTWTQVLKNKKFKFQNPFRQNYKHKKFLENILKIKADKIFDIIIFMDKAKFPNGKPENVFYPLEYIKFVHSQEKLFFTDEEISNFLFLIDSSELDLSDKEKSEHIDNIMKKKKMKF